MLSDWVEMDQWVEKLLQSHGDTEMPIPLSKNTTEHRSVHGIWCHSIVVAFSLCPS